MPFTTTIAGTIFHFIWNGDTPVLVRTEPASRAKEAAA